MNKPKKKIYLILTLVSVFLCACPGITLLLPGIQAIIGNISAFNTFDSLLSMIVNGILQGGWMVCPGAVLMLAPILLAVVAFVMRKESKTLDLPQPTGISQDDPIPPTS